MNLQENIQRIRQMMGLITENIDDILDKMNQGQELSQDEKDRMDAYSKHLESGGNESNFEYQEKEKQPDTDYVYKIDDWGRLDLNTPTEQVWRLLDDKYKGLDIAEGTEKWKPWAGNLLSAGGKQEQPDEQLIKWRIAFKTDSQNGYNTPVIGIYNNIDTGEKEVWATSKLEYFSRENYKNELENPNDEDLKSFVMFLTTNNSKAASPEAIQFGKNAFETWVEKTFGLESGEYKFNYLSKSDRMRSVLQNIKDNIVGNI